MKNKPMISVGDVRRLKTKSGYRVFRVTGIFLGGVDVENLVGIQVLDKDNGSAWGKEIKVMLIPYDIFATLYTNDATLKSTKQGEQ